MYLIDSIGLFSQSVVALYIYRVELICPARNPITRAKSMKTQVVLGLCLDRSDRSDPPVAADRLQMPRPVRLSGHTGQRLDRSVQVAANFGRQQCIINHRT